MPKEAFLHWTHPIFSLLSLRISFTRSPTLHTNLCKSCDSILKNPCGSPVPACIQAKSFQSRPTLCDPVDCSPQASLSMGFSRQGYRSGLLCPSVGGLPDPGIEPSSPAAPALADRFFTWFFTGSLQIPYMKGSSKSGTHLTFLSYFFSHVPAPSPGLLQPSLFRSNSEFSCPQASCHHLMQYFSFPIPLPCLRPRLLAHRLSVPAWSGLPPPLPQTE